MHILVLSDRFFPEISAPSVRILDHARYWLELGHEVTVVTCAPNFPRGKLFSGYKNKLYQVEWIKGVRVIRIWSYMAPNKGKWKRILDLTSFMLCATFFFWRYPSFDILLASSPPLFVAVAGYVIAMLRRRPWVFEIRDLWPLSVRAVGISGERVLKPFEKLEYFLYRKADRIVSVSPVFKEHLTDHGISPEKNDVVTNGVDTEFFHPGNIRFDARERLGIAPTDFLSGYIGTVGMAHGLETILDAAELCKEKTDMYFLIMGEGAEREALETKAKQRGLSRVIFHDFVSHNEVPSYIACLDVSIVHQKPHPLFKTIISSKIFEMMAMGIPILCAFEGITAEIIAEIGAGTCIAWGDPSAMSEAILQMKVNRTQKRIYPEVQNLVAQKFSRRAKAQDMIRCFNAALGRPADLIYQEANT